jgi:hypothetical protein
VCVPVVKATTREAGSRGKHDPSAGVLKSRGYHRSLEAVAGSVDGGRREVSTLRRAVVGAVWGDVVPVSRSRGEALEAHAPIFGNLCPATASGLWVLTPPAVEMGAAYAIG